MKFFPVFVIGGFKQPRGRSLIGHIFWSFYRQMPFSSLFGIAGAGDTVLKADAWTELVFIDDVFEILQDFRPICIERGPVCL